MAVDHKRIREILGEREEESDTSLRGNSMRRAVNGNLPRTMTPFEWEQWYAENGMPKEHRAAQDGAIKAKRWARVKRIFRLNRG
jgi:hypothetical protein